MTFLSFTPFVPSGPDFDTAMQFFRALGFAIAWNAGDYVGFGRDGCTFILQRYDNPEFAQNLMLNVAVTDVETFWQNLHAQKIADTFGVRISPPTRQPYGKEVNIIDPAGVCWHFVES